MNNKLTHFTLVAAGLSVLAFTACSKHERTEIADTTKDVYQDTKAAVVHGWANLTSYTFEKRDAFTAELKVKQAQFDVQVSEIKASYAEDKASASRKAAMAGLRDSEADYKEKFAALGKATADTWDADRDNVAAAWDRLQLSYQKARAGS